MLEAWRISSHAGLTNGDQMLSTLNHKSDDGHNTPIHVEFILKISAEVSTIQFDQNPPLALGALGNLARVSKGCREIARPLLSALRERIRKALFEHYCDVVAPALLFNGYAAYTRQAGLEYCLCSVMKRTKLAPSLLISAAADLPAAVADLTMRMSLVAVSDNSERATVTILLAPSLTSPLHKPMRWVIENGTLSGALLTNAGAPALERVCDCPGGGDFIPPTPSGFLEFVDRGRHVHERTREFDHEIQSDIRNTIAPWLKRQTVDGNVGARFIGRLVVEATRVIQHRLQHNVTHPVIFAGLPTFTDIEQEFWRVNHRRVEEACEGVMAALWEVQGNEGSLCFIRRALPHLYSALYVSRILEGL